MYERLLVPLDGSEVAEVVLPFAESLAGPLDLQITLVRVVEPLRHVPAEGAYLVNYNQVLVEQEKEARAYLEEVQGRLQRRGLKAAAEVRTGLPAEVILEVAAERKADVIAMCTHGRTGLKRLLFGSVAQQVLSRSPLPVLLVRMPEGMGD
ncbi:MAG: universal stress protein [Deltaproteobacteria bacterium]|nr:universal stress protein [Deltaproteobacteria bacterium]MBI3078076.1 universal stress protein [Deltaproteobacteria bacterium]